MKIKAKLSVLFIVAIAAISIFAGALTALADTPQGEVNPQLYYFVNCAEELETPLERNLNLKGRLGSGDRPYGLSSSGADWGYVGTVTKNGEGSLSLFNSYTSGASLYKFDISEGSYQIALGLVGNASISINGKAAENVLIDGKGVKSYDIVTDENISVSVNGKLAFIAVSQVGAKVLLNVESDKTEIMEYGETVESMADGYFSDGSKSGVAIDYDNLRADEFNANFSTTKAVGTIEGTEHKVERTLMSMPANLIYFVNCGSMVTGDSLTNDVYHEYNSVVLNHFDTLKNDVIDQEYSGGANWGYTPYSAAIATSGKPLPQKPNDPYPPAYPYNSIRCIDTAPYGIEYTFGVDDGRYNIFIGTRSHWHSRKAIPYINGDERAQFNLDASNRVHVYKGENSSDGKLTVKVNGTAALDEGSIAFIAIQPASEQIAEVPPTPKVESDLKLGETEITVKNVKADSKIQVSLTENPYSVIFEAKAEKDGDFKIDLNPKKLQGVFKLRVTAVTSGGASANTDFYITDITKFNIETAFNDWTTENVKINLTARAESNLVKLDVIHNFFTENLPIDEDTKYDGSFMAKENGLYEFKIYSETGSFVSKTVDVKNIDRENPVLNVGVSLSSWENGKTALSFNLSSIADLKSFRVYSNGALVEEFDLLPKIYLVNAGRYTFSAETKSGKISASAVNVSDKPTDFTINETVITDGKKVSVSGIGNRGVSKLYAYRIDGELAERLTVVGSEFNVYSSGKYAVAVVYEDGSTEINVLDLSASKSKKGCGSLYFPSNGGGIFAILIPAFAALVVFSIKRKTSAVKA